MLHSFLRLTKLAVACSLLLPAVVISCSHVIGGGGRSSRFYLGIGLLLAAASVAYFVFAWTLDRARVPLEEAASAQASYLDRLPGRWASAAIVSSAAMSLLLELSMIRWQGSVWEFFAFYKNFGLLSCFAGLGLGYALAARAQIPLALTVPMLTFQMLLLIGLRSGIEPWRTESLRGTPFAEQLNMGLRVATEWPQYISMYSFLLVVMLLTALAFVPIGQLCGRLLQRTDQLKAYGMNLLGSLLGVVLMMALSYLWTPPLIWFLPCIAVLLVFMAFETRVLLLSGVMALAPIAILAWPIDAGFERIYSPYQLLERRAGQFGLTMIVAAGHYYQRVFDLSPAQQSASSQARDLAHYYEFPYRARPGIADVAVVGAGTGNDVAAALRSGAQRVDAIEIDPVILRLGALYHPERPYSNSRVTRVVNDARSFLRQTNRSYDMVVYGMLDSHTLLSHASSVRLDSFVYTVEGLREGRARLNDSGVMSLSFSVISNEIGRKIYLMMTEAFDGTPPICVEAFYDGAVIFLQQKRGGLVIPPDVIERSGFHDITAKYAAPDLKADVSTDDWPFFYMPRRVYPFSYLYMMGMIVAVSGFLFYQFTSERPRVSNASFFLLGAGFMLVETKGITELGLVFGNTWQVIGIVISGILVMAFLANVLVQRLGLRRPLVPYLLLLASLVLGWWIGGASGFASTPSGRLAAVVVLTCPLLFSGIVFSTLLAGTGDVAAVLAVNLLGAMVGGMLEYNSMYFGFRFLYVLAILLYGAALVMGFAGRRGTEVRQPSLIRTS